MYAPNNTDLSVFISIYELPNLPITVKDSKYGGYFMTKNAIIVFLSDL